MGGACGGIYGVFRGPIKEHARTLVQGSRDSGGGPSGERLLKQETGNALPEC